MYIFTRYVVTEILKIFFLSLMAFTLLFTLCMGVKEGQSRGLPPLVTLHIMPFMSPEMLGITIPVSLLLAVSIVYGRMTGSNEIVALKSLGVSPMDVLWPTIVLALIFSIGTLYLQELAATWGRPNVIRVATDSAVEIAYGMLQKSHTCKVPPNGVPLFEITVKSVVDKTLINPTITIYGQGNKPKTTIRAAGAKLETDLKAKSVKIKFWDYTIDYQGQGGFAVSDPGTKEIAVPIIDPGRDEFHRDWLAMHEIYDKIDKLGGLVWDLEQQRKKQSLLPQNAERSKKLADLDKELKDRWWQIYRLQTEPYRRLSNGFTCLCFVLLGAPVAMLWRHADVLTNFFVCFLPILAIYYPLLMIGENLSTSGALWPISFWMGNVTLIVPAIFLLKWVVRH